LILGMGHGGECHEHGKDMCWFHKQWNQIAEIVLVGKPLLLILTH
jgi:hypothetical protein